MNTKSQSPRPISAARRRYLAQTRVVRVSTGRECPECFSFGAHTRSCDKARG